MIGTDRPEPGWYREVAAHLGRAYLDYRFTRGTLQEAQFLHTALSLRPGARLLDVGTGPGRHAIELGRLGIQVVGVDTSPAFLEIARESASAEGVVVSFFEMDAANLPFEDEFDAVISICEGAFGLGEDDLAILRGMTRALKPGGHAAVAAAHTFHVLHKMSEHDTFDPVTSILRSAVAAVVGEDGSHKDLVMWNSCYTARELEWIGNGAGLDPDAVIGVAPGEFAGDVPTVAHPELLLLARKPARTG